MFDWLHCVENMMQQFFEWLHSLFTWQLWPFSAERIFWCLFHCYSFMLVFICELIWFPFPPFRATCQRLLLWNVLACNSKQESTWTIIIIIIFTPHMSKRHLYPIHLMFLFGSLAWRTRQWWLDLQALRMNDFSATWCELWRIYYPLRYHYSYSGQSNWAYWETFSGLLKFS